MTDTSLLAPYKAWRAALPLVDQTRLTYEITNGEPLFDDIAKAEIAQVIPAGVFSGLAKDVLDAMAAAIAKAIVKALTAP